MISALKFLRRSWQRALAALCIVVLMHGSCLAEYPERPVRLLPVPAGGAVDHVARLVTARMAEDPGGHS